MDPEGYSEGLESLRYAGFDIMLIQLLSEQEIEPDFTGPLRLIDSETDTEVRTTVDKSLLTAYRKRLRSFLTGVELFCLNRGIEYLRSSTIVPFEDLVLKYLRQGMHFH
jgi:hypothetical protein